MSTSAAAPSPGPNAALDDVVELKLDRAVRGEGTIPLLLTTCPRCASAPATRVERHVLRAIPPWLLLVSVLFYAVAVAFAVRASDFVWYHSLLPRSLYSELLGNALVATLLVPPAFAGLAIGLRMLRPRLGLKVSTCASCDRRLSRTALGRSLAVVTLGLAWAVTAVAANYMGLAFDLALVLYVPVTAIGIAWFSHLTNADRLRFVRDDPDGPVLRVPRVFARVIREQRPTLVRSIGPVQRTPQVVAALVVACATLFALLAVDEGVLVCPVDARSYVSVDRSGAAHHWCVLDDGTPHGRYQMFSATGELRVVGGFDQGRESGTWARVGVDGQRSLNGASQIKRPWVLQNGVPSAVEPSNDYR